MTDPTAPQTPSQLDARAPMDNDAAPTRLDFEILRGQVISQSQLLQRLALLLPSHVQAEYADVLQTFTPPPPTETA